MQVKLPTMGTGVPDSFSGKATEMRKPAGRLKASGSNIEKNGAEVKRTVQKSNAQAEKFAKKNVHIKA